MGGIARLIFLTALINFSLVFQASAQLTPEQAAAVGPFDPTGEYLTARGLIGEWAYGGCTGNGSRRTFRVEPNGAVFLISHMAGNVAGGSKSKVVGHSVTKTSELHLYLETPNTPPNTGNRIVSTQYRLEGATLKVIASKDDTGAVFVENGRWAFGGSKGQDAGTAEKCSGPAAAGSIPGPPDGLVRRVQLADGTQTTNVDLAACIKELQANPENPAPNSRPGQAFISECVVKRGMPKPAGDRFAAMIAGWKLPTQQECNQYIDINAELYFRDSYINIFLNDKETLAFLDYVLVRIRSACRKDARINLSVRTVGPNGGESQDFGVGNYNLIDGKWSLQRTFAERIAYKQAQKQRARDYQNQRVAAAQAKQNIRNKVFAELKIEKFVSEDAVAANPFIYKNFVVGMFSTFRRMLSESEAVFSYQSKEVLVTAVPSTRFKGNESVVLAVRILGNKTLKVAGGEIILPYGEYVGVYQCTSGCLEFVD